MKLLSYLKSFFLQGNKSIESNNIYPFFFTLIFIFILLQYPFNSLDGIFYDLWIKYDPLVSKKENIILVPLDEQSDEFLGEIFPYSYATHWRFIDKLSDSGLSQLVYFLPFVEADSIAEEKFMNLFKQKVIQLKKGGTNFRFGTNRDAWGEQLPPDNLISLGYSLGILHQDGMLFARDFVNRRVILNVSGENTLHLWSAKKHLENSGMTFGISDVKGAYYDEESDATFAMYKYANNPLDRSSYQTIPFHQVVTGTFPKGFFKDKIVLVGPRYISRSLDVIHTPFSKEKRRTFKLNVHAEIINALLEEETIYPVSDWVTDITSLLLAIVLSIYISRVQPTKGLILTMTLMLAVLVLAFFTFVVAGVWFKISHLILSVFVVYYIWIPFRAIGEYQTRYAIQEETKILRKVENLKQNFISLMSHDLKTPVAKIAGIADLLINQYNNSSEQKEMLNNIAKSTQELNQFITSILDLTKIESSNLSIVKESKDINSVIEKTISSLEYEARSKEMKISQELSPLYPINIDVNLMTRVISNIVGNSIKYAGFGKEINIKSYDDEQWVYIEISDNGKGINNLELENIFEKFYRVKDDDSHKFKGSGLGLYLVKYFVELHGGFISVESNIGEGTKFTIKLVNA